MMRYDASDLRFFCFWTSRELQKTLRSAIRPADASLLQQTEAVAIYRFWVAAQLQQALHALRVVLAHRELDRGAPAPVRGFQRGLGSHEQLAQCRETTPSSEMKGRLAILVHLVDRLRNRLFGDDLLCSVPMVPVGWRQELRQALLASILRAQVEGSVLAARRRT